MIISYWALRPDDSALLTAELGYKPGCPFVATCRPWYSNSVRLPRSSIKISEHRLSFHYQAAKSLHVPILGPELDIRANEVEKVCLARCMQHYLARTSSFAVDLFLKSLSAPHFCRRLCTLTQRLSKASCRGMVPPLEVYTSPKWRHPPML